MTDISHELVNVPFAEMVESLAMAIARAQHALDLNALRVAQVMSGSDWTEEDEAGNEICRAGVRVCFGGQMISLLELGFTPTFYQFADTVIEVRMQVSLQSETRQSDGWEVRPRSREAALSISTVSATVAARNQLTTQGTGLLRTRLIPLPAPAIFTERVRRLMEIERALSL